MSNLAGTIWLFSNTISLPSTTTGCEVSSGNTLFSSYNRNYLEISASSYSISYDYELNAGGSISRYSTMVYSPSGWDANYQTITFTSEPTTFTPNENTFMTWLKANAIQIVNLKDTKWIFNDKISTANEYNINYISAEAGSGTYQFLLTTNFEDVKLIRVLQNGLQYDCYNYSQAHLVTKDAYKESSNSWTNNAYKTIWFNSEPVTYYPDKYTFFKWLQDNAVEEKDYLVKASELQTVANKMRDTFGLTGSQKILFPDSFSSAMNMSICNGLIYSAKYLVYCTATQYVRSRGTYTRVLSLNLHDIVPGTLQVRSHGNVGGFMTYVVPDSSYHDQLLLILFNNNTTSKSVYANASISVQFRYYTTNMSSMYKIGNVKWSRNIENNTIWLNGSNAILPSAYISGGHPYGQSMTRVYLNGVTTIGDYAFTDCYDLSYVEDLTNTLSNICSSAFLKCSSLSSVSFQHCGWIYKNAFAFCTNLQTAYFNSGEQQVGEAAFSKCTSLKTIHLMSCTYIYSSAFYGCTALESIYLSGSSVPTIYSLTFSSSPVVNSTFLGNKYASIYVPASLLTAYQTADYWSDISARLVGV